MVTGEVVNFAARLQTQAPPDGIVMDERTCEATRHAIAYEVLPLVESAEFWARPRFRVIGLTNKPPTRRLQAEMIGRDEEMQFLQALYRRVVEGRHPHLVTVIAAAGIGKTRLVEEFLQRLTHHDPPPHVLRGRCPAYGEGLTYWPLLEMLKQECDITDYDPVPVAGQKLHDAVLRVCEPVLGRDESEMVADDLATMAGTEIPRDYNTLWKTRLARLKTLAEGRPVAVRDPSVGSETRHSSEVVLHALRGFLYARARNEPLVLVFEDLHWAEQSLLELLERLTARGGEAPLLILCLARPDLLERYPTWGMRGLEHTALTRLTERHLVEARPASSVAVQPEFAFCHALIREMAYSTLPKAARSDQHRRLATSLQERAVADSEEFLEILAHHREHAWRYRFE